MDAKSLKGIAVVSIEQGEKVGTVDNILFDFEGRRVIAFKLIKPGLLRSGGIVVMMDDVESIGKDAVMVRNKDKLRELKAERDLQSRADVAALSALRVVSQEGTYIGNLATVQFDTHSGKITDLEVSGSGLMERFRRNLDIPASEIVSMGSDVVVVPEKYAPAEESDTTAASDRADEPSADDKKDSDERIVH